MDVRMDECGNHGVCAWGDRDSPWEASKNQSPSSVDSAPDLAATMAGATTIPIKARAIKRSCIVLSPFVRLLGASPLLDNRLDGDKVKYN